MTSQDVISKMKADKCSTPSRSKSKKKHHNFSNKYTQLLGKLGYKGIKKDGYFSKFYSYGVVGHCCIFVLYWLIQCGYKALAPNKGYIWNTNQYAKWLKTQPTIKGLGQVDWTTDWKKARDAVRKGKFVVVFKGSKGHKGYTHTCVLLDIADGYVKTVDGNVKGKYNGKKINNGVIKKRKRSKHKWGFAILPIPVAQKKQPTPKPTPKPATSAPYAVGKTYKTSVNLNVRTKPSTKNKKVGTLAKGKSVKALAVKHGSDGSYWIKFSYKGKSRWVCGRIGKGKVYIK